MNYKGPSSSGTTPDTTQSLTPTRVGFSMGRALGVGLALIAAVIVLPFLLVGCIGGLIASAYQRTRKVCD